MITEQARVVNIGASGELELEVQRQTACGQCEVQGACGVGAIGRLLGSRKPRISLHSDKAFQKGDIVTVGIPEGALIRVSLIVYLLPLLALLMVAVVGQTVFELSEWLNVISSLLVAYVVWRVIVSRVSSLKVELLSSQTEP